MLSIDENKLLPRMLLFLAFLCPPKNLVRYWIELTSDVLMWTPSHGRAKTRWPARTYIQQLCADTGCNPKDLLEAVDDREGLWERVKDIGVDGATWWNLSILNNISFWVNVFRETRFKQNGNRTWIACFW